PNLELLTTLLVDVRGAQHGVALDPRRKRNRTRHLRAGPLGRLHDVQSTLVQRLVVVGLHPNPNLVVEHGPHFLMTRPRPAISLDGDPPRPRAAAPLAPPGATTPAASSARCVRDARTSRAPIGVPARRL